MEKKMADIKATVNQISAQLEHDVPRVLKPDDFLAVCNNNMAIVRYVLGHYKEYKEFLSGVYNPLKALYCVMAGNNPDNKTSIAVTAPMTRIQSFMSNNKLYGYRPIRGWQDVSKYIILFEGLGLVEQAPVTDEMISASKYLQDIFFAGKEMPNYYRVVDLSVNMPAFIHRMDAWIKSRVNFCSINRKKVSEIMC